MATGQPNSMAPSNRATTKTRKTNAPRSGSRIQPHVDIPCAVQGVASAKGPQEVAMFPVSSTSRRREQHVHRSPTSDHVNVPGA